MVVCLWDGGPLERAFVLIGLFDLFYWFALWFGVCCFVVWACYARSCFGCCTVSILGCLLFDAMVVVLV